MILIVVSSCGNLNKKSELKRNASANDGSTRIIRVNFIDHMKFILVTRNKGYELSCDNPIDLLKLVQATGFPTLLLESFPPLKRDDEVVKALKIDEQPILSCTQGSKVIYKATLEGETKYFFATAKGQTRLFQIGCQALADAMKLDIAAAQDIAPSFIDELKVFTVSDEDDINCIQGFTIGRKVEWEQGSDQTVFVKSGQEIPSQAFAAKKPDGSYAKFTFTGNGTCNWIKPLVIPNTLILGGTIPQSFHEQSCTYTVTADAGGLSEDTKTLKFTSCAGGTVLNEQGQCIPLATNFASHADLVSKAGLTYASHIYFVNEKIGWVVGSINRDGVIYKSIDGGITWEQQFLLANNSIQTIAFANTLVGWAIGESGIVLHTKDGGVNWVRQETGSDRYADKMQVGDENHVWIARYDSVLSTKNGGRTWETWNLGLENGGISSMEFIDSQTGYIVATYYTMEMPDTPVTQLLETTDGGEHWAMSGGILTKGVYPLLSVISPKVMWIGGYGNDKLRFTNNGGSSWSEIKLPGEEGVSSIAFLDDRTGYVVQGFNLYFTKDGGKIWQLSVQPRSPNYFAFAFDAGHLWLIGSSGELVYSVP